MKKIIFQAPSSLLILLAIFSFFPKLVLADGMLIEPDPYSDRWDYSSETNQQALINYENGLEKMIISVEFDANNSSGVVWLFPVPADPQKVAIDVVKNLPQLSGEEISGKAKSYLDDTRNFLSLTQLYPIPLLSIFGASSSASFDSEADVFAPMGAANNKEAAIDVVVYEHLDKEGISSEIITAKTANGLYDYLKAKGLNIKAGTIPVLDNYIGKDYSFLVSWISSTENPQMIEPVDTYRTISTKQRGIIVTFPTKEIYFPLLPTSVYGSETVPATIRVFGHVSPKIFQDIKGFTKTEYYVDGSANFPDELKNFYSGKNQDIKYTKVELNAPSKFLTDDLWFRNHAPIKTYYSSFVAQHPIINWFILLILSSIITGILAGLIVFKDLRKKPIKLGLIGLSNSLTIVGLLITTLLVSTKNRQEDVTTLVAQLKQKGYCWKRKTAAILFFLDLPFLVLGLDILPILIQGIQISIRLNNQWGSSLGYFDIFEVIILLIIYALPLIILLVSFFLKRTKPEDKTLFEQLKASGYSSWSFQPKDKLKIAFIPIFSIFFLTISWLLVKIIELTV